MKLHQYLIVFVALLLLSAPTQSQSSKRYVILFKDKAGTPHQLSNPLTFLSRRAIDRRYKQSIEIGQRDLPVSPTYLQNIRQTGAKVWYSSRWLNGAVIEATLNQLNAIKNLAFVRGIDGNRALNEIETRGTGRSSKMSVNDPENYGASQTQIQMLGADKMHQQGFRGEGMLIAVFDGGFLNADKISCLKPLFDEKRVISTYDFVNNRPYVFDDANHGTHVLSCIGAYQSGGIIGTVFKASFVLCKTEDDYSETRIEEANWLVAAEYADSLGVDVINSSLGYSEFDDPATNYTYANMNGKTTLITRAADWAAAVGMVVVTSAGNEGNKPWRYISAPADADSVLAVGAVDRVLSPASFTSRGPSADGRIKPDVAAMGQGTTLGLYTGTVGSGNGTSFSAPLIAGLVAGFWQAYPHLSNMQVMDIIRKSGTKANAPDTFVGHGIPDFSRASALVPPRVAEGEVLVYPNVYSEGQTLNVEMLAQHEGEVFEVALYDTLGTKYWQTPIKGRASRFSIDTKNLMSGGVYLLRFQGTNKNYTTKVVVVK